MLRISFCSSVRARNLFQFILRKVSAMWENRFIISHIRFHMNIQQFSHIPRELSIHIYIHTYILYMPIYLYIVRTYIFIYSVVDTFGVENEKSPSHLNLNIKRYFCSANQLSNVAAAHLNQVLKPRRVFSAHTHQSTQNPILPTTTYVKKERYIIYFWIWTLLRASSIYVF